MSEQQQFILNELWFLTINAAFQRANVYANGFSDEDEGAKRKFKSELKNYIDKNIIPNYNSPVAEDAHIKHIYEISEFSKLHGNILEERKLNFGICQKLLNLYLKYLWCFGKIKSTPPHFPIDRKIQEKLGIKNPVSWTKDLDEEEYINIINLSKEKLSEYNKPNIAELELYLYSNETSMIENHKQR
ncbi:MAG: hypothetical protein Q8908_05810 [Bacteroidota bacterium]|nr:hypothetical protein [Bacteroidota bacterium]